MITPAFTLDDIQYSAGSAMYARARELFEQGKVADFQEQTYGYSGMVQGTKNYRVVVSARALDQADCTCYMGQNDQLCKHVLALALKVLKQAGSVIESAITPLTLDEAKLQINAGIKKIKAYTGPSKIWFSYQRQLSVGAGMIVAATRQLPPTKESATLIWKTVLRLSRKLATGGIDDSDGVIGYGCCGELIAILHAQARSDKSLAAYIQKFVNDETGFGFEDELRAGLK